jgi:hypothetical protein
MISLLDILKRKAEALKIYKIYTYLINLKDDVIVFYYRWDERVTQTLLVQQILN